MWIFMLKNSETKVLIVGERYLDLVKSIRKDVPELTHVIVLEGSGEGALNYDELLASSSEDPLFPESEDEDTTILMYTAGTTGEPKGVMLTHNSFSSYLLNNVSPADPEIEEKNILTVPLYHIAGMQAVLAAIYGGRTLVIQRQFEPSEWLKLVEEDSVNRAMMVPTMLKEPRFRVP